MSDTNRARQSLRRRRSDSPTWYACRTFCVWASWLVALGLEQAAQRGAHGDGERGPLARAPRARFAVVLGRHLELDQARLFPAYELRSPARVARAVGAHATTNTGSSAGGSMRSRPASLRAMSAATTGSMRPRDRFLVG